MTDIVDSGSFTDTLSGTCDPDYRIVQCHASINDEQVPITGVSRERLPRLGRRSSSEGKNEQKSYCESAATGQLLRSYRVVPKTEAYELIVGKHYPNLSRQTLYAEKLCFYLNGQMVDNDQS
ncbi:hypothetical protein CBL_20506 [Carabus blaptoides fortunei]